ncbi:MAG: F0F1 ATP synthase subunit delta [Burkholderiaceae bacterium]
MAEISTIARPYAEALFRVAVEDRGADALKKWSALVSNMSAVAADPDMRRVMNDPRVSGGQIYGVFMGAVSTEPSTFAQNFVRTLIDNDRLSVMPEIGAQFAQLVDAKQGIAEAHITSAFAMDESAVSDLVAALEKKFEIKLKPVVEVDPDLIGGVRVVVGDRVLDTSVRSRLDAMKAALVA